MMPTSLFAARRRLMRPGSRGYALAVLATLALGIGAVVAVYSILHQVMLAPLPFADESRVVRLAGQNPVRGVEGYAVSHADFRSWQDSADAFEAMAAYKQQGADLRTAAGAERIDAVLASEDIWQVTGIAPLLGRGLSNAAEDAGAVLVSESFWTRHYAGDADVLGRTLVVDGRERSVVGVVPDDVGFSADAELWMPLALAADEAVDRGDRRLTVLGRLEAGVAPTQAQAQLAALAERLARQFPDSNADWGVQVQTAREWLVGEDDRQRLWLVGAAVALLLLATCTNLASLQLARVADRQREFGIRQAVGADRARVRRDMLAETAWLLAAGAAVGVPLAAVALDAASVPLATALPRLERLSVEPLVVALAVLACAATAVLFALIPAAIAARTAPASALSGGRGELGGGRTPLRTLLVVAQFAVATVLVAGALVLGERLLALAQTDLGFEPQQVLTARIGVPAFTNGEEFERERRALDRLVSEVAALPGVRAAAIASDVPLGDIDTQMLVAPGPMPIEVTPAERHVQVSWRIVSSGYFDVLGVPLLSGRLLREDDEVGDAVVLSRSVADQVFGSSDPVGRMVTLENGMRRLVVGVVGDTHQRSVAAGPSPTAYLPTSWYLWETMTLSVRTEGDPSATIAAIRDRARGLFPDRPLYDIRTMEAVVAGSMAAPRLQAGVVAAFASAALLIAAVGIGGVTAYLMARRRPEFALRVALGASPARLRNGVLVGAAARAVAGIVAGAGALALLARAAPVGLGELPELLAALASTALLLLLAAIAASWLPARRAARVDPGMALRGD